MKSKKKVAVIGAGILGLNTAYKSALDGMEVTIFEKQEFPPANASSIAGGMLAPFSEIEALPLKFVQAGLKGISFWRDNLGDASDACMQSTGSLFIAHREDRHMLERFAAHMPNASDDWRWVEGKDLAQIEPMIAERFSRGLYVPAEANVHPLAVMDILAAKLKDMGANIIRKEADPKDIKDDFDWVVDCRGWAPGIDKDLRGIKGEIILLENKEFELSRPVRMMHPRYPLYIIPRPDDIFAVGASAIENADDDDGLVFLRSAMELMSAAYSLHPSFGDAKVIDMSSAIRPAYMDNLPRINIYDEGKADGEEEAQRGYIRCNGTFRHGYLLSPVMGNCVAHYIKTGEKNDDFALFSGQYNYHVPDEDAA